MADKYLISGATYNGDGTASNEAASAGAAGAWNNINIITGTAVGFGTLAAGDTVYIRSKTSAGADITVTLTASINLGFASATAANWVTWVLDGGDVWSGVQGVLRFTSAVMWTTTFRDFNEFIGYAAEKLVIGNTNAYPNDNLVVFGDSKATNLFIDFSTSTTSAGTSITVGSGNSGKLTVLTNLKYKIFKWYRYAIAGGNYAHCHLINPDIEALSAHTENFIELQMCSRLEIDGGRIHGNMTGVTSLLRMSTGALYSFNNLQFAKTIPILSASGTSLKMPFYAVGTDGSPGAVHGDMWGVADSRNDGFYPYLNATLPDSGATGWSWKIYPRFASLVKPFVSRFLKLYTDTAAAKKVTVELQIADHFTALNRSTLWATVNYVDDSTVEPRSVTSKITATTALTTSTASWSATAWGAVGLLKRKIEVTTPTAIKQNTTVQVLLSGTSPAPDANGMIFVDPDIQLSTP